MCIYFFKPANNLRGEVVKHNKMLKMVMFLFIMSLSLLAFARCHDHFDVMIDFAYPMSDIESLRQDITQGLYFLQQSDHEQDTYQRAVDMFEQANSRVIDHEKISSDDYDFLQAMLDQINDLIAKLESEQEHRSHLSEVCSDLNNKF